MMDELRTLPKAVIQLFLLKLALAIVLIISLGLLLVGGISAFLYLSHYSKEAIILFALLLWAVFILFLLCLFYRNQALINKKKTHLLQLVQAELFATVAVHSLNVMLRKWRKEQDAN